MSHKILIIGGTGMLGQPVTRKFIDENYAVSVMSTNPDKAKTIFGDAVSIVEGDITKPATLAQPCKDNDYVYINISSELDPKLYTAREDTGIHNIATAAADNGVQRIGILTGASSKGEKTGELFRDIKVTSENHIIESGVPYHIFRPSWFFETLPQFIQQGRAVVIGEQPLKISWLAAKDYANQVFTAFDKEETKNKAFYNFGPEQYTMLEALTKYCEKVHPDLTPEVVSFSKAKMVAMLPGMKALKKVIPFFEYFSTNDEDVDPTEANNLLGKNQTTLDQWLAKR